MTRVSLSGAHLPKPSKGREEFKRLMASGKELSDQGRIGQLELILPKIRLGEWE